MSEQTERPAGLDKWTLWNAERQNARHFDGRAEAEAKQDELSGLMDTELYKPGEAPDGIDTEDATASVDDTVPEDPGVPRGEGESIEQAAERIDDSPNVDVVDHSPEGADVQQVESATTEPVEPTAQGGPDHPDLPDRSVSDDPLTWIPGEFVDNIDGSQAINRKGFEVLAHFYDVSTTSDLQVKPEDEGHEYCRVKATATIDGRTVEAFGSAHVDRGDDPELLLEMADTRARKRALSIATGVGAVAVEELKNEVQ